MKIRYLAAAIALSAATASSAAVLVVRSSGPSARSFPPGTSLAENGRIALKANDLLVVLDARGTRTLRGPGTFTPGGPAKAGANVTPLSAVTRAGAGRGRARVGAVRNVGMGPKPNVWHVDASKSSNVCVTSTRNITLWRPDPAQAAMLTVSGGGSGANRQLKWGPGQSTMSWPSDLPISEGVEYQLAWDGAAAPARVQFRTLPSRPTGLENIANTLIKNGCTAQLDVLIETAKAPEAAPAPQG